MTEFETLRGWLSEQSGKRQLNEIARRTGVNRRTIQRIVNNDGYSVNLKTFSALKAEMEKAGSEVAAAA
jgi:DNA-binding LacI/PurR family transcriptional regulator